MERNKERYWEWGIFCFVFGIFLILCLTRKQVGFMYDSQYYWAIGDLVLVDGEFNILNFPETFRGYVFPVLLQILKHIGLAVGNEYIFWYIFSGILFSTLIVWIMPSLFNIPVKNLWQGIRVVVVFIILYVIWGDLFYYPLSDMPAFYFLSLGILLLKRACIRNNNNFLLVLKGMISGVCLYAAYNTRAAYLYGVLICLILFSFMNRNHVKSLLVILASVFIGMVIIALPQARINHQYVGKYSPKVYTEQYNDYSHGLEMQQVYWGLTQPRYETYAGSSELYPSPSVYFDDPVGQEILRREHITIESFGFKDVARLILKYPLDMVGIYTKHLISMLTPLFGEVYIQNIYTDKGIIILVNMVVWILAGIYFLLGIKHKNIDGNCVWLIPFVIPCLLQMFGACELRFFLGIHLIVYYYVLVCIDYAYLYSVIKGHLISVLACSAVVIILWISVISDILSYNREETLLIHDDKNVYSLDVTYCNDE